MHLIAVQALNVSKAKRLIDSTVSGKLRSHLDLIRLMRSISSNPKLLDEMISFRSHRKIEIR